MEQVTQAMAATAEESAAAGEELNAQAATALGHVRDLEAIAGGAVRDVDEAAPVPRGRHVARPSVRARSARIAA